MDVLPRIPGLRWLAAGQLDGLTDTVLKVLDYTSFTRKATPTGYIDYFSTGRRQLRQPHRGDAPQVSHGLRTATARYVFALLRGRIRG